MFVLRRITRPAAGLGLALALITPIALPAVAAATPAHGLPTIEPSATDAVNHDVVLDADGLTLTSSTGHHLTVDVSVQRTLGGPDGAGVNVDLFDHGAMLEQHDWYVQVPGGDFHYNASTGTGTLKTGKSLGGFGKLSLSFHNKGVSSSETCQSTTTVTQPVIVGGSVDFDTHSTGSQAWGTVSASHRTGLFDGPQSVETDTGNTANECASEPSCRPFASYAGPLHGGGNLTEQVFSHDGTYRAGLLFLGAAQQKVGDVHASRVDYSERSVPLPTVNSTNKRVKVVLHPSAASGVTGTATLVAKGAPTASTKSCAGGKVPDNSWKQVSDTNGSSPLTVDNEIFGNAVNHDSKKNASVSYQGFNSLPGD